MSCYIIASCKEWYRPLFEKVQKEYPQIDWYYFSDRKDLNLKKVAELSPKYIFFPHWSWIVPEEIYQRFECICFHSSDVPYGRGGSPIQNLIAAGHVETKISALRMVKELDAGPVYMKEKLSLEGTAEEIFKRAIPIVEKIINKFIINEVTSVPQDGEVTLFKRRSGKDNLLPQENLGKAFDYIRMLDCETYPQSYIQWGKLKIEFSKAKKINDRIECNAVIIQNEH